MVKSLDGFSKDVTATTLTASRDQFSRPGVRPADLDAAQAAFKMDNEPDDLRDRTAGRRSARAACWPGGWSRQGCRSSRSTTGASGQLGWDTHQQNFPTIKDTLAPPHRPGPVGPHRRPGGARAARQHAGRDDGRVRPHAQDQRQRPAATTTAGPTAPCSPVRGIPKGLRPGQDRRPGRLARPTSPSPPPTSPPRSTLALGIDPNEVRHARRAADRGWWITARRRGSWERWVGVRGDSLIVCCFYAIVGRAREPAPSPTGHWYLHKSWVLCKLLE